jgi:hypothetical protein
MNTPKDFFKKVDAVNYLYEYIPQIVAEAKRQLDPHIGKPIFRADGSWRKSVNWNPEEIKKQLPNGDWLSVTYYIYKPFSMSDYLNLCIKVCLNGGKYENRTAFTIYEETAIEIYKLDKEDNIIETTIDLDQWNQRFNADDLVKQAEVVEVKHKELQAEIDKIHYRFRDSLYIPRTR